jgi:CBS domain-containing protein
MRSPFTGAIFVLELTHDQNMLLPLLVAVVCAHGVTVLLLKRSILTEKVSRRGFHLSREYQTDPLEILFVREVMDPDVPAIPVTVAREEIAEAIGEKRREQRLFTVVDTAGELVGVVTRWVLEEWAAQAAGDGARPLSAVMQPPITAFGDEPLRVVVNRMAATGRTDMPVVERAHPNKLVGHIALRDMLKARVRHLEEEQRRERVLPLNLIVPSWLRIRGAPTGGQGGEAPVGGEPPANPAGR